MPQSFAVIAVTEASRSRGQGVDTRAPGFGCPVENAQRLLSGRWTFLIAYALLDGNCGFSDLRRRIGGISGNVLAQRLRTMTDSGIVAGGGSRSTPYRLTDWGLELAGVRVEFERWVANGRSARNGEELSA